MRRLGATTNRGYLCICIYMFIFLALRKLCNPFGSHWLLFRFYELWTPGFMAIFIKVLNFPCFGKQLY